MANLRDSAVEEIEPVDRLTSPGVGEPTGIEPRRTIGGDGSSAGLAYTVREVMRVRMAKFAAVVLFVTFIAAVFAPWLAPYDPTKSKPWDSLQAPSSKYWLGADRLGRDQLSRLDLWRAYLPVHQCRGCQYGGGHGGSHRRDRRLVRPCLG